MVTNAAASLDLDGLVVVLHAVEPDPLADFYGHSAFHVVPHAYEPITGETLGELLARVNFGVHSERDRLEIRFPTVAEQRAALAVAIDAAMAAEGRQ